MLLTTMLPGLLRKTVAMHAERLSTPVHSYDPINSIPQRSYEFAALRSDESLIIGQTAAPALPLFETAFAAFSHGSVVQTVEGPIAVEDLQPGDMIQTAHGCPEQLIWVGSTTFSHDEMAGNLSLARVMPDAFGPNRPANFVTFGPAARLLKTPMRLRRGAAYGPVLTPIKQFSDGNNVIEVSPPSPVRLFHLCLARHSVINVGGLDVESYHPGPYAPREVTPELRDRFLSLFPRFSHVADFGPMIHDHAPEVSELIG